MSVQEPYQMCRCNTTWQDNGSTARWPYYHVYTATVENEYSGKPINVPSVWMEPIKPYSAEIKPKERMMQVFDVIIVDREGCHVISRTEVVAENREKAMFKLDLPKEIKALIKKDVAEILLNCIGEFKPIKRDRRKED